MHDPLFENFDISLEDILERLYENEIIKRETRDYKTEDGETLFKKKCLLFIVLKLSCCTRIYIQYVDL